VKICFKCGKKKALSEFYKHPQMGDGHLNKCKECTKKDSRKTRADNLDYYQEYDRNRPNAKERAQQAKLYQKTKKGKIIKAKCSKNWGLNNPEKRKAQNMVNNAVRDGKIIKLPCEHCDNPKSQGHHPDYTKPLEVIWLCATCHSLEHKLEREKARQQA